MNQLQASETTLEKVLADDAEQAVPAELERFDVGFLAKDNEDAMFLRVLGLLNRYDEEMDRFMGNADKVLRRMQARRTWLWDQYHRWLEYYTRQQLGDGKVRSVQTPFGVAGFRKQPAKLVVQDMAALKDAWTAGQLPTHLLEHRVIEHLDKDGLNELYKHTGEIPPGCVVEEEHDRFYVR